MSLIDTFDFSKNNGELPPSLLPLPLGNEEKGKGLVWVVHQEERSPIFSLSPPRCIFSFFASIPKGIEVLFDRERMVSREGKKVFLIFRSGETFRSSPKEEERRIANIQSLLFVREKLCRQGERTFSVLCTVGFSYCAKNIRMYVCGLA